MGSEKKQIRKIGQVRKRKKTEESLTQQTPVSEPEKEAETVEVAMMIVLSRQEESGRHQVGGFQDDEQIFDANEQQGGE